MKVTINRDDLLKPLLEIGSVVEKRQTLPILANILIKVKKNGISFTATDLEVELKTTLIAQTNDEFEFTLPARKLIDICKALPDNSNIEISIDGEKAILKSGRGRYTMGVLPASDYPSIETPIPSHNLNLSENALKTIMSKVSFAMALQDVRYYLNGMLLDVEGDNIKAVATDGHRLALSQFKNTGEAKQDPIQIILPRKAVVELSKLLSSTDNKIQIELSSSHIKISLDNTQFISKLIDGRFPDYERVMPQGETSKVIADRELLKQALQRTAILSNEKYRGIRFSLEENLLKLQAHNPEQDQADEELEINYSGNKTTIGFNVGYLLDVLSTISSDDVHLNLIDANSSTLITSTDEDDNSQYVVMPMRL